jgi:hypothetical protein
VRIVLHPRTKQCINRPSPLQFWQPTLHVRHTRAKPIQRYQVAKEWSRFAQELNGATGFCAEIDGCCW